MRQEVVLLFIWRYPYGAGLCFMYITKIQGLGFVFILSHKKVRQRSWHRSDVRNLLASAVDRITGHSHVSLEY